MSEPLTELDRRIAALPPEKRRLLELRLKREGLGRRGGPRTVPLRDPADPGPWPLTWGMQRLWFVDQLAPGSTAYNIPFAGRLAGELDVAALAAAFREVVRRHEVLRSRFAAVDGRPVQLVDPPPAAVPVPVADLAALPAPAAEREAERLVDAHPHQPFDLAAGPLYRVGLVRRGPRDHWLMVTMPHVVTDAWSMAVLFRELPPIYEAIRAGRPSPLPDPPIQVADYALWQRAWLAGPALEDAIEFWRRRLAGAPAVLELPADRPRPPVQSLRGRRHYLDLTAAEAAAVRALADREGATVFMVLLAAFNALLLAWTGRRDQLVATPIATRSQPETHGLIGFFIDNAVLRVDAGGDPAFRDLVARVRESSLATFDHGDLPFDKVLEAAGVERDLSRPPLVQLNFVHQNVHIPAPEFTGLELVASQQTDARSARFELTLGWFDWQGGLRGGFEYAVALFDRTTIVRFAEHYRRLLLAALADPGGRLSRLDPLSPAERHQLLVEEAFPPHAAGHRHGATLDELVRESAARHPDHTAAAGGDGAVLTYRELAARGDRLAAAVAARLAALGAGPEPAVGYFGDRSPEQAVALYGILAAGAAAVPLDPALPAERLRRMIADAGVRLVVAGPAGAPPPELPEGVGRIDLDKAVRDEAVRGGAGETGGAALPPRPAGDPDRLAYVLYTSGSTGEPKGVEVTHRAAVHTIENCRLAWRLTPDDRVAQVAAPGFDPSILEVFTALAAGARLEPIGRAELLAGAGLVEELARRRVSVLATVPTLLAALPEDAPAALPDLRLLVAGGEPCPPALAARWREGRRLINAYGPTEAAIEALSWEATGDRRLAARPSLPIGRADPGTAAWIAGAGGRPAPLGVPGELWLAGGGLARGYRGRPAATAAAFRPDPWSGRPGARAYATGDRARRLAGGLFEFLGREDRQVKIRGQRIEIGEVEAVLAALPGVAEAAVAAIESAGRRTLAAWVVAHTGAGGAHGTATLDPEALALETLRAALARRLPEAAVPSAWVRLDALPRTAGGKIDRAALPAPGAAGAAGRRGEAPRDGVERALAEVWRELLGVERVGVDDDFFALGGDSIASIRMIARAADAGIRLTPQQVFGHPRLGALAAAARESGGAGEAAAAESAGLVVDGAAGPAAAADPPGPVPLTPMQRWFFGLGLAAPHHWNLSLWCRLLEPLPAPALAAGLTAVAARHGALRLRFVPQGAPEPAAEIAPAEPVPLPEIDLGALPPAAAAAARRRAGGRLQGALDLARGPLSAALVREAGERRLLLTVHHLAIDAVSWGVVLSDLERACRQAAAGAPPRLEPPPVSYREWAERWAGERTAPAIEAAGAPAISDLDGEDVEAQAAPVSGSAGGLAGELPGRSGEDIELPPTAEAIGAVGQTSSGGLAGDPPWRAGEDIEARAAAERRELDAEATRRLLAAAVGAAAAAPGAAGAGAGIEALLLTALAEAAAPWTGGRGLVVDVEGHGRGGDADLSRTVGWLTAVERRRIDLAGVAAGDPAAALAALARPRPAGADGTGGLTDTAAEATPAGPAPVSFNYLGRLDALAGAGGVFAVETEPPRPPRAPANRRPYPLEIDAWLAGGRLTIECRYGRARHRRETVASLLDRMLAALGELAAGAARAEAGALALRAEDGAAGRHPEGLSRGGPVVGSASSSLASGSGGRTSADGGGGTSFGIVADGSAGVGDALDAAGASAPGEVPLTSAQERLWFLDRLEPGNPAYNIAAPVRLTGRLDRAALAGALSATAARHEALRATFHRTAAGPVARVAPPRQVPLPLVDLAALPPEPRGGEERRLLDALGALPFALDRGPLLRAVLLTLGAETAGEPGAEDGGAPRFDLHLALHHIAADGWSISVLVREIAAAYSAYSVGSGSSRVAGSDAGAAPGPSPAAGPRAEPGFGSIPEIAAPPPSLPLAEVARRERAFLAGPEAAAQLAWWRERLAGLPPELDLPADRPRRRRARPPGGAAGRTLSAELARAVRALAREGGATPFMVLLAALEVLLGRLSGQLDFAVGTPVAGRGASDGQATVGLFLNHLALRSDLPGLHADRAGGGTFRDLLARVRASALDAFARAETPFERVIEVARPERDLARTPLFQVFLNMLNFPAAAAALPGLALEELPAAEGRAMFDWTLYAKERPGGALHLELVYDAGRFDRATAAEALDQLALVLEQVTARPDLPLDRVSLRTAAARAALPDPEEPLDAGWPGPLHEAVGRHAAASPDRVAVADPGGAFGYGAVEAAANRLAHLLARRGVRRGDAVAILAVRAAALVPAVLAIHKAGAAALLLDPAHPPARNAAACAAARPRLWIDLTAGGAGSGSAEDGGAEDGGTTTGGARAGAELIAAGVPAERRLALPPLAGWPALAELAALPETPPAVAVTADDAAFLTFTSGSTGRPKGVVGRHRSLTHFIPWMAAEFGLGAGDRFSVLSGLAHDPLQRELWTPLWLGAAAVFPDPGALHRPGAPARWLRAAEVTVAHLTPATARLLSEPAAGAGAAGTGAAGTAPRLPALRRAFFLGDLLTRRDVARLAELAPAARAVNLYGATETQRAVAWHPAGGAGQGRGDGGGDGDAPAAIPLGRGMPDVQLVLLAPAAAAGPPGVPAGIGEVGEIAVRSPHLAAGYLDDPAATAARFVPAPRDGGERDGERLYRTGDLGRYRRDGAVVALGRGDRQVKVRGVRVEPAEVEAALAAHPAVAEAAVIARGDGDARHLVAAWVAAAGAAPPPAEALRDHLRARLPEAMVPAVLVALPALPLTPNRKLDRDAIAAAAPAPGGDAAAAADPPRGATEELVAAVWREVLGVERVGRGDGFFALGGHSLRLIQVLARLEERLGVEVPVRSAFEAPTLAAFAARVDAALAEARGGGRGADASDHAGRAAGGGPVPRALGSGPPPASFAQERLVFLDRLEPGSSAYNMPLALALDGALDRAALRGALTGVAARHEALRTTFAEAGERIVQRIAPPSAAGPAWTEIDLTALPAGGRDAEAAQIGRREAATPFDLARGPLLRARLVRLAPGRHRLLLTVHHAVADAWSLGIVLGEAVALYGAAAAGRAPELPPPPLQYADFALWERARLDGAERERQVGFWRRALAGVAPAELPVDRPRGTGVRRRGGRVAAGVPDGAGAARIAARLGATPFMVLLAAFAAVLHRFGAGDVFAVATPVANRRHPALERVVGFFANTLALPAPLGGDPAFDELVGRLRERALDAFAHQELPFAVVVAELNPPRDRGRAPIAQVLLALENAPRPAAEAPGIRLAPLAAETGAPRYELGLALAEAGGGFAGQLEYDAGLFDRSTARRIAAAFAALLDGAVAAPGRRLSELPLLSAAERHALLCEHAGAGVPAPPGGALQAAFFARAAERPDAVAVTAGGGYASYHASYGRLARRARRIAAGLRARGIGRPGREDRVGLLLPRSLEWPAAVLGVLEAGAAWVPLDPAWPPERVAALAGEAGLAAVIDAAAAAGGGAGEAAPEPRVADPDALAYVIFTSGSTGRPKGVAVSHRAASMRVAAAIGTLGAGPATVLAQTFPATFDPSVIDLFAVLSTGGRLALMPGEAVADGSRLAREVRAAGAGVLILAPALAAATPSERLPALGIVGGGGEAWPPAAAGRWARGRRLLNFYGPTEGVVYATVGEGPGERGEGPPLGGPVPGSRIHVVDRALRPVPAGVAGELAIGGPVLARGYLGRPAETADRFRPTRSRPPASRARASTAPATGRCGGPAAGSSCADGSTSRSRSAVIGSSPARSRRHSPPTRRWRRRRSPRPPIPPRRGPCAWSPGWCRPAAATEGGRLARRQRPRAPSTSPQKNSPMIWKFRSPRLGRRGGRASRRRGARPPRRRPPPASTPPSCGASSAAGSPRRWSRRASWSSTGCRAPPPARSTAPRCRRPRRPARGRQVARRGRRSRSRRRRSGPRSWAPSSRDRTTTSSPSAATRWRRCGWRRGCARRPASSCRWRSCLRRRPWAASPAPSRPGSPARRERRTRATPEPPRGRPPGGRRPRPARSCGDRPPNPPRPPRGRRPWPAGPGPPHARRPRRCAPSSPPRSPRSGSGSSPGSTRRRAPTTCRSRCASRAGSNSAPSSARSPKSAAATRRCAPPSPSAPGRRYSGCSAACRCRGAGSSWAPSPPAAGAPRRSGRRARSPAARSISRGRRSGARRRSGSARTSTWSRSPSTTRSATSARWARSPARSAPSTAPSPRGCRRRSRRRGSSRGTSRSGSGGG